MEIKPYPQNAKEHPEDQIELIARSIQRFGWQQPIKVGYNNVIIVGHGRWFAYERFAKQYKLKEPWIVDQEGKTISGGPETRKLTKAEERAYRIADNQINALSGNNLKFLKPELKFLDKTDTSLFEITGFDKDIIIEPEERDDVAPSLPKSPKSKRGDIYQLGNHRIMCGDSTDPDDISLLFGDHKADMVFTDPPYNVNYKGSGKNTSNTIKNDSMSAAQFDNFLTDTFSVLREHISDRCALYVCYASKFHREFENALNRAGFVVYQQIIWVKRISSFLTRSHYRWKHEPIMYARIKNKTAAYYGDRRQYTVWEEEPTDEQLLAAARELIEKEEDGDTTVWKFGNGDLQQYKHPTQKPVQLCSSKLNQIVADLFLGSGSTLIAAEKVNRVCIGMELDPKYVDVIVQRYVNYSENESVVLNGKEIPWPKTT